MAQTQKHLLTLLDWDDAEILATLDEAIALKRELKEQGPSRRLEGRTIALYFEKASLRTLVTFQVGMAQMGGSSIMLPPASIGLGMRETIQDASKCLGRWVDGIVIRCYAQKLVDQVALHSGVATINALTDEHHPCQALALGQTIIEKRGSLKGKRISFVGDGNNVANSIAVLAARTGMHFTLACPEGYEQPDALLRLLEPEFRRSGGSYRVFNDPRRGVSDADLVYADIWASMGKEHEKEERAIDFRPFQVNGDLMSRAPSQCLFSHCLPAHRGDEVTDEVMDSPNSLCFDEAENRLHAQKAVLVKLLGTRP